MGRIAGWHHQILARVPAHCLGPDRRPRSPPAQRQLLSAGVARDPGGLLAQGGLGCRKAQRSTANVSALQHQVVGHQREAVAG